MLLLAALGSASALGSTGRPLSARAEAFTLPQETGTSAWENRTDLGALELTRLPEVGPPERLKELFLRVRDARDWRWREMEQFPRRLSWLYPADGCFLRASFMAQRLRDWRYPAPAQLFAFGELSFSTPYETVHWWYHVAPIYLSDGQPYVVDPAVDFREPLPLSRWIRKLGSEAESMTFAICGAGAVSPEDDCSQLRSSWNPRERYDTLQLYLAEEWYALETLLGEPPERVLGEGPPWVSGR
ncbi:MAG: protein-glutamine glutaminase family protein [Oligoflexia bacterium]|nr:protein-glutamine glutaminase family protein [Oligoflexia bacterium]